MKERGICLHVTIFVSMVMCVRSARAREECLELQAQTNALQSTIAELEQKIVEVIYLLYWLLLLMWCSRTYSNKQ